MKKVVLYDTETLEHTDLPNEKTHWGCKWFVIAGTMLILTTMLVLGLPHLKQHNPYEKSTGNIQKEIKP